MLLMGLGTTHHLTRPDPMPAQLDHSMQVRVGGRAEGFVRVGV